jgi:hypothetical protein
MEPIDVIKSLLPQLTDKQKEEIKNLLAMKETPCAKLGHKYGKAIERMVSIWKPKEMIQVCSRCGHILKIA